MNTEANPVDVIPVLGILTTLILHRPIIGVLYLLLLRIVTEDKLIRISYILLVIVLTKY